jgi:hypothetical protein
MWLDIIWTGLPYIISLTALGFSIYSFRKNQKVNFMPILVFVRRTAKVWHVQNIGKGPAIAVEIASRRSGSGGDQWGDVITFHPIAEGGSIDLDLIYLKNGLEFGAYYKDVKGRSYSSLYINGTNQFFERKIKEFSKWQSHPMEFHLREKGEEYKNFF